MMLLCSVILTNLAAVVPTKLESGIFPMELKWEGLKMNFIETEEHKLYASIVAKGHLPNSKEGYSNVKYQIPAT